MPTIAFHIGLHKTGTTAFQRAMARSRAVLSDHGIVYPRRRDNHSRDFVTMFGRRPECYLPNRLEGLVGERLSACRAECREHWARLVGEAGDAHIVVSGEDLSTIGKGGWERLCDFFSPLVSEIMVLAVVREPLAWARSNAQQAIKGGATIGSLDDSALLERPRERLVPVLEVLGRDRLTVLRYEDLCRSRDGLVAGIARALGVPGAAAAHLPDEPRNPSLSGEAALLLSALNETTPLDRQAVSSGVRKVGDHRALLGIGGTPFRLPEACRARVEAAWAEEEAFLRDEFGIECPLSARAQTREEEEEEAVFGRQAMAAIAEHMMAQAAELERISKLCRQKQRAAAEAEQRVEQLEMALSTAQDSPTLRRRLARLRRRLLG